MHPARRLVSSAFLDIQTPGAPSHPPARSFGKHRPQGRARLKTPAVNLERIGGHQLKIELPIASQTWDAVDAPAGYAGSA